MAGRDKYVITIEKRLGEDRFFFGAFDVFRCISAFFSCVLFGDKKNFRIFACGKGCRNNLCSLVQKSK